jgi:flagellar basal-body rod protein FlgB
MSSPIFSPIHHKVGNKNLTLLSQLIKLGHKKQNVLAQNIAHAATPNYRYQAFGFEQELREALREGNAEAYEKIMGEISRPNDEVVRHNGNNVNLEAQLKEMNKNQKMQKLLAETYNHHSKLLSFAIKGGH